MLIRLGQIRAPIALCTLTVFVASLSLSTRVAAQQAESHAAVADSVEETREIPVDDARAGAADEPTQAAEPRGKSAAEALKQEEVESKGVDKEQVAEAADAKAPDTDAQKEAAALTSGEDKSGVTSKAISVPKGSGTVQGMEESFSAQLSTGIATYSVGFALPTARGGVQPSLGLSYSSSGGHGTAGVGWNVGVSFISRQTDRGLPKYNTGGQFSPDQDRFVFNGGQELVPICDVTSARECSGALPGEIMPEWSPGWQYHRPRVEGGFMRFFWSPDGLTWRVQSKDGTTLELGVALDGKRDRQAIEANPDKPEEVYRWNLRREFDTYHDGNGAPVNVAYYGYTHEGATAYLTDIYDTSPADDPTGYLLSSGTALDFSRFAHHTRLVWEERSDPTFSYRSGWRMEQNLRLARVDVTSASYGNEARELVRRYLLDYDSSYHVSLLSAVTLSGRCPDRTVGEDASGALPDSLQCIPETLPPTRFDYSHVGPSFDEFEPFDATVRPFLNSPPVSVDEGNTDLFDINSDGLPDVLATAGSLSAEHRVYFNGASGELTSFGSAEPMGVDGFSGLPLSNPNVVPLDLDGDGRINLLHMPKAKQYSVLSPEHTSDGWVWRNRTVATAGGLSAKIDFTEQALDTKVVDVDFDGLVDLVVSSGTAMQTFFALGRYPGGDGRFGTGYLTGKNQAQFQESAVEACVPRNGNIVLFSQPDVFLGDMNGDGINDIVRMRSGDIKYWPGRGNGFWGTGDRDDCKPGDNAEYRSLVMTNPPTLQGDTQLRLDDVNGDGLSDIIQVRSSNVDIWINVDGKRFTNRRILSGTPSNPSNRSIVRIADVDGSGTRDIVWGDGGEYRYIDLLGGTRPWVLTEVRSGLGKTTTLEYTSSIDEMLQAERDGKPWASKAPMALHLVKRMTETDNLNVFDQGERTYGTEYSYRDPVYDGRQREFRGFREATSKAFGDANSPTSLSRSTFLLGECLLDNGEACPDNETWLDNPHEALKGLPVLSETYDESGVYLATSHNEYTLRRLYEGLDGRGVVYAFSNASTSWAYDTAHFIPSSTRLSGQATVTAEGPGVGPSITTEIPLRATSGTVRTRGETTVDDFGNQLTGTSYGCVSGCPAGAIDEAITGVSDPVLLDHPSGWLWRTASSYTVGSVHTERRGETATSYTAEGNPDLVTAVLTGTEQLQRSHATGGAVAPTPGDAVSDSLALYVSETDYDQFGNAIRSYGPGGRCADVFLDPLYAQLATTEMMYPSGCPGSRSLTSPPADTLYSAASYDRGLELVTHVIDVTFQTTHVEYDGLGRTTRLFRSEPNSATVGTTPAVEISYDLATEGRPYSVIHTRSQDGATTSSDAYMESYAYIDGMGRTLVGITEADPSANDEGQWIVGGFVDYDKKGAVSKKFLPKFWDGDPLKFDLTALPGTPFGRVEYDAFGRDLRLYDLDETPTLRNVYHALSSDAWDAADFAAGGPHTGTYATSISDGHGRGVIGIERFKENGSLIERRTETTYLPTGEPISITRSSVHGSTTRWLRYDSLGRMVLNVEPHTSVNFNPDPEADATNIKAWRYRYNASGELVGTSDARGCGLNFAYDGVGRLQYEDYSPCEASHQPYSAPSPDTASGIEVYYLYDRAPPPEVGTPEVPNGSGSTDAFTPLQGGDYLRGKLVAVFDRAKVSVTNYDGRSRAFESWVRLAAPGVPNDSMPARYGGRWYRKQVAFDGADRVVSETTGAQSPELMGGDGQSHVDISYSQRGTVKSVGGSYGSLVTDIKRTADGLHQHIEYGDLAKTRTQFAYDTRRRLATVQTYRGPPAAWGDPSSSYSHAGIGTDTFQKVLQDDHYHYDVVGNPLIIEDLRNPDEWPAGAKPVTRTMEYDDLYRVNRVDYGYTERDDSIVQPEPMPTPWGLGPSGGRTRAVPRVSASDLARFHQETAKPPSTSGVQPKSAAETASSAGVQQTGVVNVKPPSAPPSPSAAAPVQANQELSAKPALNRAALDAVKLPDVSQAPAPKATAITNQSPSGALSSPYVFTWTGVSDATGYLFRLYDGEGYHHDRQVDVADLGCSGGGTCTYDLANASPSITLGQGAARWNVRITGGAEHDDWGTWINVSVGTVETLTASTLTAPPALTGVPLKVEWTGSLGASHYVFDVRRVSDNALMFGQTRQKYEVCTGTTCALGNLTLATGDYTVQIRTNSEHNLSGPWSNTLSFHTESTQPIPITPAGLTADTAAYQFTAIPSVVQYRIRWVGSDGSSFEAYPQPHHVGCSGSGICTYNWTRTFPDGPGVWGVQAGFGGGVWTSYRWADVAYGSSLPSLSAPTLVDPDGPAGSPITFRWESALGVKGYEVELLDASDNQLAFYQHTKNELGCAGESLTCSIPGVSLSLGNYSWRARAIGLDDTPGPWSAQTSFSIDEDGPTPITPSGEVTSQPTQFRFTPRTAIGEYKITVYDASGGSFYFTSTPTNAGCANGGVCTMYYTGTIPDGAAVWGVQGGYGGGVWTPIKWQNFSIGPVLSFETPVQLSPSGLVGSPFDLEWEFDEAAARYDVLIWDANDQSVFSNEYPRANLNCGVLGSTCTLQDVSLPPGNYTWWVRPQNAHGTTGTWSAGMQFEVDGVGPTPVWPNADIPVGDDTPTYRFTTVAGATQYQWKAQLSDGSVPPIGYIDPVAACDGGYCEYEPTVPLPTGAHRWWVRARFADNSTTAWKDLTFSYGGYIPLGLPDRIAPKGTVTSPFHPVWSRDPGATWYDLWFKDASNTQIYFKRLHRDSVGCGNGEPTCTGPEFTYAPGNYTWFIASVNPWNRGAISLAEPFTVTDIPLAPTVLAPIGNLHDPVPVYSWTSQPNVTSYQVRVEDSFGSVFDWTFTPGEASCTASQCDVTPAQVLKTGSHTVWVRAVNSYGEGPWSTPEQFYLVANLTNQDDTWDDPNADPVGDQRRAEPSPYQEFENRIRYQTWKYDWLGNTTETDDDAKGFYDRSLGDIQNGSLGGEAYQLTGASNRSSGSTRQGDLRATYDVTGNLTELRVDRDGTCIPSGKCSQVFRYQWDEVGRLVTAKRWDAASLDVTSTADPVGVADVELHYAYDAGDMRVSKRAVDTQGEESNTLYIFNSLELRRTIWDTPTQDYALNPETEVAYLFANGVRLARLAYEAPGDVPSIGGETLHVFFELGDHLGSTSLVLDKATGELVERSTYQAYGGSESDYRPERWKHFREDYRFTGKEEDVEVGLIYFGKRFLNPLLNRWVSADPLAVHGLGADPNLYAYVSGRALQSVDPLGLEGWSIWHVVLGPVGGEIVTNPNVRKGIANAGMQMAADSAAPSDPEEIRFKHMYPGLKANEDALRRFQSEGVDEHKFKGETPEDQAEIDKAETATYVVAVAVSLRPDRMARSIPKLMKGGAQGLKKAATRLTKAEARRLSHELDDAERSVTKSLRGAEAKKVPPAEPATNNCFVAGTPVLTSRGFVAIEEIAAGDLVLAMPDDGDEHGALTWRRVEETYARHAKALDLTFETQVGEFVDVGVTHDHPFWVEYRGWTDAGDIRPDDRVWSLSRGWLWVRSVHERPHQEPVYNLKVAEDHTYFASGLAIWVHNANSYPGGRRRRPTRGPHAGGGRNDTGGNKIPDDQLQAPPSKRGNAPIGEDGSPVELHHRGQTMDSPLDEMTFTDHRGPGNYGQNHANTGQSPSEIDRAAFAQERTRYWKQEWDNGRFNNLGDGKKKK